MEQVNAPWTPEQVRRLNEFQKSNFFHPFTCGRCRDVLGVQAPDGSWWEHELVATINGWICPTCDYTQDWAWDMMTNFSESDFK